MKVVNDPVFPDVSPIKMWTDGVPVEISAMEQLKNISSLPFIFKHIAVMPDVHLGRGATVGSVIPTKGAIIPAAVGVDIGCGMMAVPLGVKADVLPDSLKGIRLQIEAVVPVGFNWHKDVPNRISKASGVLWNRFVTLGLNKVVDANRFSQQIGTLGGGNHFIELCLDESDEVWIMLHSGSRGVGNKIGQHYINLAKEDMRKHFVNLPDVDLAYFPEGTDHFDEYFFAVGWAQDYARVNRDEMMVAILEAVGIHINVNARGSVVNCHHNYVGREHHFGQNILLTRKGAVDASYGRLGIIPGSMGQKSYIVRGKGNPDSFNSCSHGAGRKMSRTAAKKEFTVEDLKSQTEGVECRKDAGVLDEIPSSYKNLDDVMAAQSDLVEIVHTLKAILTVKG
jgi:tRNA-splicing ligase RtcB